MRLRSALALLIVIVLAVSCVKRPKGLLSDKETASLLADLEVAGAVASRNPDFRSDSSRKVLRQSILESHGVSEEQYDFTMDYMARNPDVYAKVMEKAMSNIQARQKHLDGNSSGEKDDESLWPYGRMVSLNPLSGRDAVTFSVEAPSIPTGAAVDWSMHLSEMIRADLMLGVEYSDGSIGYTHCMLSSQLNPDISLQTDSTKEVSRLFGSLDMRAELHGPLLIDSISLRLLPLRSEQYNTINRQKYWNPEAEGSR